MYAINLGISAKTLLQDSLHYKQGGERYVSSVIDQATSDLNGSQTTSSKQKSVERERSL